MFEQPERATQSIELVKQALSRLVIAKDNETITRLMRLRVLSQYENARITLIGESDRSLSSDIVSTINLLMTGGLTFIEAVNIALVGKYNALAREVLAADIIEFHQDLEEYSSNPSNVNAVIDWANGVYTDAQATAIRMDNNSQLYENYIALSAQGEDHTTFAYGSDFQAFDSIANNFRSGDRLVWNITEGKDNYRFVHSQLFESMVQGMLALSDNEDVKRDILSTLKSGAMTDNYLHTVGKPDPMQRKSISTSGKTNTDIVPRVFPGCAIAGSQQEVLEQMLELSALTVDWYVNQNRETLNRLSGLHSLQVSLVSQAMIELLVQISSQVNINNIDAANSAYTLHESGRDIVLAAAEPLLIESLVDFAKTLGIEIESPFAENDKNSYAPIFELQRKMILSLVQRALSGETIDFTASLISSELGNSEELEAYLWSTNVMHELVIHLLSRKGKRWHTREVFTGISKKAIEVSRKLVPELRQALNEERITAIIHKEIQSIKLEHVVGSTEA